MNICILESTRSCNVLTNQLWLPLFSILLSSLAVRLLHASSLWLTSLFSTSLTKLVRGVTRKSIFWNNEVFISRYYYYFSISRARSTCVLHVVFFFFHICCTAIAVIKSNLFLENFFQIFNPWGFLNWCIISLYGITAEANISLMRISSSHYPKKSFKNSMENKHADLKM